ncbi:TonB-dependent receptor [Duganella sp. FT50W]|uniref:TonB-dependent receptor n=1 Tax=Duganella lactea TaxID=2692173 RepID=A0A6L8MS43_9BURK|nr:TonB-dependent receptor [Duganella lactea]MYM84890.1 TonB-dependent receptor [Duganella lactea]
MRPAYVTSALLVSCAAYAQQPTSDSPVPPSVEIKADTNLQRKNETASKIVIGRDDILKFGDQSVVDVMKRVPGVTVIDATVRLRGLGNGYTQILVNGDKPPAGFSLDSLSPDSVEKIEVMPATSAEYSAQAIAGTINIELKKSAIKRSQELKLNAGGVPGTREQGVTFSRSDKLDRFSYTVGGTLNHSDAELPSSGIDTVRDNNGVLNQLRESNQNKHNEFTGLNLNSRLNWALEGGDTFAWQTFLNSNRSHGNSVEDTATLLGPVYPFPILNLWFVGNYFSLRSDATWNVKFESGNKLNLKVAGYVSRFDRGMHRLGSEENSKLVLDRQFNSNVSDKGGSSKGKYSIPYLKDHALSFGWDAGYSRYSQHDIQNDVTFDGSLPLSFNNLFDASITRLAGYGQDEWDISSRWSLYLGLRWEGIRTRTSGQGYEPTSSSYSVVSPVAQSLWKVPDTKGDQVRVALTRTYKAPELSRLVQGHFYTAYNTSTSPDFIGNPHLRPELATGIDVAYERYWAEGALLSLSANSREIHDLTQNNIVFDGSRWVSSPINNGAAHVRGIGVESKFPLRTIWLEGPAVNVRAEVYRNWSRVDSVPGPNNRLDRQPQVSAVLGVDYQEGAYSGGASFSFASRGWARTSPTESQYNTVQRDLEAYFVYKMNAKDQLRFTIRNALKTGSTSVSRYQDMASNLDSASSTTSPGYLGWRLQYEHKF